MIERARERERAAVKEEVVDNNYLRSAIKEEITDHAGYTR